MACIFSLLPVPHLQGLHLLNLALELEEGVEKCLSSWGAARAVNIYGENAITSTNYRVGVVVVASTISTGTHGDDPTRFRHLKIMQHCYHTNSFLEVIE